MPKNFVNEKTDEKINNYLTGEAEDNLQDDLDNIVKKKPYAKNKKLVFAFLVLLIIFIVAYLMYLKGQGSFDNEKVIVEIEAPNEILSGEEITLLVNYKNNTKVILRNPRVTFFVPEEFIFISSDNEKEREDGTVLVWNLKDLSAGESGKIRLFGKIIGSQNTEYDFDSEIAYFPENINYEYQSSNDASKVCLKITAVPFQLSVECPKFIINGNETKCVISYQNISSQSFKYLDLDVTMPKDFNYVSSDPKADESDTYQLSWNLENIEPNASGELVFKGNLEGERNEEKEIEVVLEASDSNKNLIAEYARHKVVIKIQETPIVLSQMINGKKEYFTYKGEELEYKIKLKNNSDLEIRGLVINSEIKGSVDFDSLSVNNGSVDNDHKITWSAFNIPKLAVFGIGEEVEVSFKIKVKDFIDVNIPSDKNFVIENKVTIKEFNFDLNSEKIGKIITTHKAIVKLDASLFIRTGGYFNDDGRIKNSGVIPPEVDRKTEYTIHWNLNSLLNDLENLRIVSVLPDNVNWTGNFIKADGEISLGNENNGAFIPNNKMKNILEDLDKEDSEVDGKLESVDNFQEGEDEIEIKIEKEKFYYNPETREIVWEMPFLEANIGVIVPAKEVVFQVRIEPREEDIGKVLELMGETRAIARDKFTGSFIETLDSGLTTELPDDYSIGVEEGIVIQSSGG